MRAVRSTNTTPERTVRSLLFALGYRFRLHQALLPGKPDIVFASRSKAIFVHGCFWHGHHCHRGARSPKTNADYWRAKIARNRKRDLATNQAIKKLGWTSLVVWECQLKDRDALTRRLVRFLG